MKATKIKMKLYCGSSKNVQDIDSIYIDSTGTYWKKESQFGEKYVCSEANNTTEDNLLKLPRE